MIYGMIVTLGVLLLLVREVVTDCVSYGTDYVNGGGPYCINTTSTDFFAFGSKFYGCQPSDTQGDVTPILIDPNSSEYFCSDIPTQPDDTSEVSICNVPGYELTKNNMTSGDYIAVIEGLTFAWMRVFNIAAGPPVTYTSTPTATFTVTENPSTTLTTTVTSILRSTLPASTTTIPSTTSMKTWTITPSTVTVTSASISVRQRTTRVFSKTVVIHTTTVKCRSTDPVKDQTCTVRPKLATAMAASVIATTTTTTNTIVFPTSNRYRGRPRPFVRDREWAENIRRNAQNAGLFDKRTLDVCSTTVIQTTAVVSTYTTTTLSLVTATESAFTTITSTITPPPVTAYSGSAETTTTITASTPTGIIVSRTTVTSTTTKTVWATITSIVSVVPTGVVCLAGAVAGSF